MIRHQGEDIAFELNITNSLADVASFDDVERVVLALYTDESKIVKFEYKSDGSATTTGYQALTLDTSVTGHTKLKGVLKNGDTKLMHGNLLCSVYVKPEDSPQYQMLTAAATGIVIKVNLLKTESVTL